MINNSQPDDGIKRIKKLVVLGGGTAGFLSALALNRSLPDIEVVVVRSTKMGVIGVGEGTIPSVMQFLHHFLGLDKFELYKKVSASPKLGIRYLWGKRPYFNYTFTGQLVSPHRQMQKPRGFYCDQNFDFADLNSALMNADNVCMRLASGAPRHNPNVSYHLENKKFVTFMEDMATSEGIKKIDGIVEHVESNEDGVSAIVLETGEKVEADFFVDCSGFRSEIIGKTLQEPRVDFSNALFCDSAVVGGWERTDETYHPFTTAETMNAGWCWQIEHDQLINRGYVFCSKFLSDDEAAAEFKTKNPKVGDARVIKFDSNVLKRSWVKNVVAIGNSAGFVEPLEATSIGMICDAALRLSKALSASNGKILESQRKIFNRVTEKNWTIVRDFLALHYKFNDRIDTPFWRAAMNDVCLGDAQEYVDYFRDVGPDFTILNTELKRDFFTAEGYLVMLVGQQVKYQSGFNVTDQERATWDNFKKTVANVANKGLSVPEFLQVARSDKAEDVFGMRRPDQDGAMHNGAANGAGKRAARVGENMKSGELNWH